MADFKVSEEAARWLVHAAERDHTFAFNSFYPYECKLCGSNVPPVVMTGHLALHANALAGLTKQNRSAEELNAALRAKVAA